MKIDLRIERPVNWGWMTGLAENEYLARIDFKPPASGPEVELTFEAPDGAIDLDELRSQVEFCSARPVLAIRQAPS